MEEEDKKVGKVKRKKIYKIPGRPASHFKPKLRKVRKNAHIQKTAIDIEN